MSSVSRFRSQVAYKKRERAQKRKEMEVKISKIKDLFINRHYPQCIFRLTWRVPVYQFITSHSSGSDEGQPVEHLDSSRDSDKVDKSYIGPIFFGRKNINTTTLLPLFPNDAQFWPRIKYNLSKSGVRVKTTYHSWTNRQAKTALRRTTSIPSQRGEICQNRKWATLVLAHST